MSVETTGSLRRDLKVIGVVGAGHSMSHFLQLTLPPLFPILRQEFGVAYLGLGLVMSVFYAASGIGHTLSGFLVDRFGARPILLGGLALLGGSFTLAGLSPSYGVLVALALPAGLGNSVFHPADYAILNATVDRRRLGRSYSLHSLFGNAGWAAAPPIAVALASWAGWRLAVAAAGGLALVVAVLVATQAGSFADHRAHGAGAARPRGLASEARLLLAAPILLAFAYFALHATGLIGFQTFSVPSLRAIYDAPPALATGALTAFLVGYSLGILTGGFLADRARRHHVVAATGIGLAAGLVAVVGTAEVPLGLLAVVTALAGFSLGITAPSRDMIVRGSSTLGASGKVFGFVSSGIDLGSTLTPLLFGWLLDRGEPRAIFLAVAGFMVLTIFTLLEVRRRTLPTAARV